MSSFSEMKVVLENLKKTMAWCLVRVYLSSLYKTDQKSMKKNQRQVKEYIALNLLWAHNFYEDESW